MCNVRELKEKEKEGEGERGEDYRVGT